MKRVSTHTADRIAHHANMIVRLSARVREAGHIDAARRLNDGAHTIANALILLDELPPRDELDRVDRQTLLDDGAEGGA